MSGPPASAGTVNAERASASRAPGSLVSAASVLLPAFTPWLTTRRTNLRSVSAFTGPFLASNIRCSSALSLLRSICDVREQPDVVIGIHGHAIAHAELAVAEADGGLETGDAGLLVQEQQTHLADVPRGPAFRAAAEVHLAVRHGARRSQSELAER